MTFCIKPTLKQIGAHSKTKFKWFQRMTEKHFFWQGTTGSQKEKKRNPVESVKQRETFSICVATKKNYYDPLCYICKLQLYLIIKQSFCHSRRYYQIGFLLKEKEYDEATTRNIKK